MAFCVFYLRRFFQGQDDFTSTKQRSNGADTEKETVPSVTRAAVVTTSGMLLDSNYPLKFILFVVVIQPFQIYLIRNFTIGIP